MDTKIMTLKEVQDAIEAGVYLDIQDAVQWYGVQIAEWTKTGTILHIVVNQPKKGKNMNNIIIVSRHAGLIEWLRRQGIEATTISHVTNPVWVEGKHVYGALPFHLAALADKVTVVDLPDLPADKRGAELTADEMEMYGATLRTYVVRTE